MKADDSSLTAEQAANVRTAAIGILNRSDAWGTIPTPASEIIAAAGLKLADISAFDESAMKRYIRQAGEKAGDLLRRAMDKVFGIFDVHADVIHIDTTLGKPKQTFLKFHETGHKVIPHQSGLYKWIQDGLKHLSAETADLFEREANNFARLVLFQDDRFSIETVDEQFGLKAPMAAAKRFGASNYAGFREYVRRHHKTCAVIVLEPLEMCRYRGPIAKLRRVQGSISFDNMFTASNIPKELCNLDDLMRCVPIAPRKMSQLQSFQLTDRNGDVHEFVGEGFRTPYQTFILIHAISTLRKTGLIRSAS